MYRQAPRWLFYLATTDEAGALFVIRIKNPNGAKIPPHWHPGDEHITVLAGTFVVGMGRTFDPAAGQELTVGSYMLIPKQMPHFAWAKGECDYPGAWHWAISGHLGEPCR